MAGALFDFGKFCDAFACAAGSWGFVSEVLIETEDGPVTAWLRGGEGPVVYISAGIHGDEPAGPLALLQAMEAGWFTGNFQWLICPALNPEGLMCGTRENRAGLDLNRDYLLRETAEVAAHTDWLSRQALPEVFISLHEDWEATGFYFYEINLGEDDLALCAEILEAAGQTLPIETAREIDGHIVREAGWIFHGTEADLPEAWPEAIWLAKRGCPRSFTFETPSGADLAERVAAHLAAVSAVISPKRAVGLNAGRAGDS